MQKIELTPATIGIIKDRLQKATAGQFLWGHEKNQSPQKVKKPIYEKLEAEGDVTLHWSFRNLKKGEVPKKYKTSLLHLFVTATCQNYYSFGDIFYFKGNVILIDRRGQYDINCSAFRGVFRSVERIVIVKSARRLTSADKNKAAEQRHFAEIEKADYERAYFKSLDKELEIMD
jgi:hypothetical protein